MVCITPPELSDEQILEFLEQETPSGTGGNPTIRQHLGTCNHCRKKAGDLKELDRRLSSRLFRADCPDPHMLGEYQLKLLPPDTTRHIKRHLASCPHCSQELAGLSGYLADLRQDLEISPLERLRVLVAGLAGKGSTPGQPALAPALAGLRGDQAGPRLYEVGEVQISLDIQEDPTQPDSKMIVGLMFGIEPEGFTASLVADEGSKSQQPVDQLGNFIFPGVKPGGYHLILTGPDAEIHIEGLVV